MATQVELAFDWQGLYLTGSLHLPSGAGPCPAALMSQGSGPADRDSGGYFSEIRPAFLDRGIATFAFDKPGCGESTGAWRDYGLQGRVQQLLAAHQALKDHKRIDADRIGVFGHSQGGWLVQQMAGRCPDVAFAIASSAPSISVRAQILYDIEQTMRAVDYGENQVAEAIALTHALQRAAVAGADFDSVYEELLTPANDAVWFASYPTVEGADDWYHFAQLIREAHDPVSDLESVACPFLAVYGGKDALLPAWQGVEESGRALAAAPSPDVTVVAFPSGDHRLRQVDDRFVPGYLDLLGDWAAARI